MKASSKQSAACLFAWRTKTIAAFLAATLGLLSPVSAGKKGGPPAFSKAFNPSTIGPGSTSTLTFTITNFSFEPVENLAFTDVLPAGVTIASPASVVSDCRGILSAPDGGTTISLTEGSLGAFSTCTIRVNVTAGAPGSYLNTSGDLTSDLGNSGGAEAELTVDAGRPGFSKSFSPSVVQFGGKSTLTFTIDNSLNTSAAFNPTFTDNLPLGMVIANPANAFTDCPNTTLTAVPGSNVITLAPTASSSLIAAGATCTVSVDVVGGATGRLENTSGSLSTSPSAGGAARSSGVATDVLTVTTDRIVLTKSFTNDPVGPGGTVDLEFSIFNLNRDSATSISFSDDLDAVLPGGGLTVVTELPLAVCGGTLSTDEGNNLVFTGGTLDGSNGLPTDNNSCTFSVTLQVPANASFGAFTNTTSSITAVSDGDNISGAPASDDLFVVPTLTLTKSFTDDPVAAGGSVTLDYTIINNLPNVATGISFSDELTAFLPATVTADLPADGFCGPGSEMNLVSPGTDRLSLLVTGAEVPANSSCTFSVTIDVPTDVPNGSYPSTSSAITGTVGNLAASGAPASDSLVVVGLPSLSKSFVQNPVLAGATVTLEFTLSLDENAPSAATNIGFSDDLGAALAGLATTPGLSVPDVCGNGSVLLDSSPGADGSEISLVGGTLQPGESCTFSLNVFVPAGAESGAYTNTTSNLLATVGGLNLVGGPASDVLNVANLVLTKEFVDDPVIAGGSVTLRYTLTNNSATLAASSISFEDDLDDDLPGLTAVGLPLSDPCGDGSALVGSAGNTLLTFVGGSLNPLESCTFDVVLDVPAGAASDSYPSATSDFEAVIDGTAIDLPNASDTLVVSSDLLLISKMFLTNPVIPGQTTTLEFTITNLDPNRPVSDIAFTDSLPAGLSATNTPVTDPCGNGSSLSGTTFLTFSGGSLPAGGSCTFTVDLAVSTNAQDGFLDNTTSEVTGTIGGLPVRGDPAGDTLAVNVIPIRFSKQFEGAPPASGGLVTLTFTIENLSTSDAVNDLSFTDDLDAVFSGMEAVGTPLADVCGPGSELSGTSVLTFSGGNLGPSRECTFSVDVLVPAIPEGNYVNATSDLLEGGVPVADPATAMFSVVIPADETGPVISGAKDIVITIDPSLTPPPITVSYPEPTATDDTDPNPTINCTPASGSDFPVGTTQVLCVASDVSGNVSTASFNVTILTVQQSPQPRFLDQVSLAGDMLPGGETIRSHTQVYLNNNGDVGMHVATDMGAAIVFDSGSDLPVTAPEVVARVGTSAPSGNFGIFRWLTIDGSSQLGFESATTVGRTQFTGSSSPPDTAVSVGDSLPGGGSEEIRQLHQPALDGAGNLLTPVNLRLLTGGVTGNNDTALVSSAGGGTLIAREGSGPSPAGPGVNYGQLLQRVTTDNSGTNITFASSLVELPFNSQTNAALFAGPPAALQTKARKGDVAPGTGGGVFGSFLGEAVNSDNEVVFRANLRFGVAGTSFDNNEGLWTDRGGGSAQLIAREGDLAPCIPDNTNVVFARFTTISIADSGDVCFFAYLRGLLVDSTNDGSIWRWRGGTLHLLAREGDSAPGTGSQFRTLSSMACNSNGGVGWLGTTTGADTLPTNAIGIWLDPGSGGGSTENGEWLFSQSTVEDDPGAGSYRLDNANPANVTAVYFSSTLNGGGDATALLSSLEPGDTLRIVSAESGVGVLNATVVSTTGNSGWWTVNVTVDTAGTLPADGERCVVVFDLDPGAGGGGVNTPNLILRRGDTFRLNPEPAPESTVVGLDFQNAVHPSGGTGGFGTSLNDNGDALLKLVLNGGQAGIFILGTPPPPSFETLGASGDAEENDPSPSVGDGSDATDTATDRTAVRQRGDAAKAGPAVPLPKATPARRSP